MSEERDEEISGRVKALQSEMAALLARVAGIQDGVAELSALLSGAPLHQAPAVVRAMLCEETDLAALANRARQLAAEHAGRTPPRGGYLILPHAATYQPRPGTTRARRWPLLLAHAGQADGRAALARAIREQVPEYNGTVGGMLRWCANDGYIVLGA